MSINTNKNIYEDNRLEDLLTKLVNKESLKDFECLNRLEEYLVIILTRADISKMGKPLNRLEVFLQALYEVVPENSVEILSSRLEEIITDKTK